jgi:GTP-binding protein Era
MTNDSSEKTGFVAVMGRPNVGKSSLINALVGQKIAAVSPRPQTTRKRQMGILTMRRGAQDVQIIFVDTPGLHHPRHKLGDLMNQEAIQVLEECDATLFVVDASQPSTEDDHLLFDRLRKAGSAHPVILALNKIDLIDAEQLAANQQYVVAELPFVQPVQISATVPQNLDVLLDLLISNLPLGEHMFPEEQMTDLYERDIAADLIREAALNVLRDEVPHGIAVRIDQYLEREEHGAYIEATIFLERESHKPIVIGEAGRMIKKIGTAARKEIEAMSGRKIFLEIKVKVRKNWRDDDKVLRQFGY